MTIHDYCNCCEQHTDHADFSTATEIVWCCTRCQLFTVAERGELWGGGKLCYLPRDIRGGTWETVQLGIDTIVSNDVH